MPEVAIFAKAPIPGFAKTRLIPLLGAGPAAALQARLMERALQTALEAAIGPVTLWCAPDAQHPAFQDAHRRLGVRLATQAAGDLGARMLAAFEAARSGGLVLIGTDCPCLAPRDLQDAADALARGAEAVIAPAEDGGYGLIAASRPLPELFAGMPWSTPEVCAVTRARAEAGRIRIAEISTVWDVDTPADYRRLLASGLLTAPEDEPVSRSA